MRVFNDFSASTIQDVKIYNSESKSLELFREKYGIDKIAGDGTDFSKAVKIMRWIYDNVLHCGGCIDFNTIPKDPISIMDYSFGKDWDKNGVYCGHQAVVFAECCRSVGLEARVINGLPFSPCDFDNHVMVMAYLDELSKWVLFDQSNNAYFTDKNGVALSPLEARHLFGIDEILVSEDLQPFEKVLFKEKVDPYKEYIAKNLFYIKFWSYNTLNIDLPENRMYYLTPMGFDVKERETSLDWFNGQEINIVSEDQFFCKG